MGGLFGEISREQEAALLAAEKEASHSTRRTNLLQRAVEGDRKVLDEAQAAGDANLYDEVLDALAGHADSDPRLLSLISYIARSESLIVNRALALRFIESWQRAPDRNATATMLHVAALSGDASTYQQAIETAAQGLRDRRVPSLTAAELRQLVESEYWILPAHSRTSGAGFALKQTMARLRRELAATTIH